MRDQTLPLKGGWILCTKLPPTKVQPKLFGVYYAKPEKVFEAGSFLPSAWARPTVDSKLLLALYRKRQNAQLSEHDQALLDNARLGFRHDGMDIDEITLEMRVRVLTEDGEVCLEPHEYSIIPDIQPYIEEIGDGMILHELGGVKNAKKLQDQLFYAMSRGITKLDAYRMLLGQIDRWNVFWLETHPSVASCFIR